MSPLSRRRGSVTNWKWAPLF